MFVLNACLISVKNWFVFVSVVFCVQISKYYVPQTDTLVAKLKKINVIIKFIYLLIFLFRKAYEIITLLKVAQNMARIGTIFLPYFSNENLLNY